MATQLTTRSDWLAANPPSAERLTQTLAAVAQRAYEGEDFRHAVREFLDEFALRGDDRSRGESIERRPISTGDPRHDAFLGALAEHLAAVHRLTRPAWSVEPERFLDHVAGYVNTGRTERLAEATGALVQYLLIPYLGPAETRRIADEAA